MKSFPNIFFSSFCSSAFSYAEMHWKLRRSWPFVIFSSSLFFSLFSSVALGSCMCLTQHVALQTNSSNSRSTLPIISRSSSRSSQSDPCSANTSYSFCPYFIDNYFLNNSKYICAVIFVDLSMNISCGLICLFARSLTGIGFPSRSFNSFHIE